MDNNSGNSVESGSGNLFQLSVPLDPQMEGKLMDFLQRVAPHVEKELIERQEEREALEEVKRMRQQREAGISQESLLKEDDSSAD